MILFVHALFEILTASVAVTFQHRCKRTVPLEQIGFRRGILTVKNIHYECCGVPPALNVDVKTSGRTCYFENDYGEQCLLHFDPKTKICRLWMGDVGWEEELRVEEFKGHVIVRFARTEEEREREFKMNKQFEGRSEFLDKDRSPEQKKQEREEIRKGLHSAVKRVWGKKNKLTAEDCDYILHCPTLNQHEMGMIKAFYETCRGSIERDNNE